MKLNSVIRVLVVFSFLNSNAQEFKLGNVSVKELEEKICPNDTLAVAAVLYNSARTFFTYNATYGYSINTENSFRIKIYKKEGLQWANYKVPFRIGYENLNEDKVEFSNGVTYNLEGGKIIKTKLENEGIFKTTISEFWKQLAITMPNVKVGSVIEFKYVLKSQNIVEFPTFNFQQDIPVNHSEYVTEIPGFFVYKAIAKRPSELVVESKIKGGSLSFLNNNGSLRTETVSFKQQENTYKANNIPALKEEPFVDNMENYRLSIQHELEKTQYYQEEVKDYSLTWEGVAKKIYADDDFGKELKERDYIAEDVKRILKNNDSKAERLDIVFKYVQNKMNWNNRRGYYVDKGVVKAYQEGVGNTADINFILIAMLNYAGIPTSPVLLSTLDNGIPLYPNRTIFNYVIAAADLDGNRILLDATNKFTTKNILPLYALNWSGRLIKEDGNSEEITLDPKFSSKKTMLLQYAIDKNGNLKGQTKIQRTGYQAFSFREINRGINEQTYLETVENDWSGAQISKYSIDDSVDLSKPVLEDFTFETNNQSEIIGDKMYVMPKLFFANTRNPFVQENRISPIYFGYPGQETFNVTIAIPEGYEVESVPKPIRLLTKEYVAKFEFMATVLGDKIQITIIKELNKKMVSDSFYPVLKDFYKQMIEKESEKIVFKKI